MREILFRGKKGDGDWAYGYYVFAPKRTGMFGQTVSSLDFDKHFILTMHYSLPKEVAPKTVGQYTGLTDKNGKKIFEGDICRFREWSKGDMCWIGKVHYEHQQFVISGNPNKECESEFLLVMSRFIPENIEIIGNIHDNPELLKGGEG
ncbi:MAG: hypothetical protein IKT39_02530 [Clostridia bacterium]|nr:hypothetical protein [Clostridia bacterium]